ncbi:MAG: hypothetical protein IT539_13575 [Bradyrhizobiaceae bacterium]|nr:hypothetical protein [Bradyrhizobiaceae bacterium]
MKTCAAALATTVALVAVIPLAAAQSQCKDGTRATLSGTIQKLERAEPEPDARIWMITPAATPKGACLVKQIWGRGQPPASCTAGKGFSATGKVADAESLWLLYADTVTCK